MPAAATASHFLIGFASTLSAHVGVSTGSQHRRRADGWMGRREGRHAVGDSESARGGCRQQEVGIRRHCRVFFHPPPVIPWSRMPK